MRARHGVAMVLTATAIGVTGVTNALAAPRSETPVSAGCQGALFDDFDYASVADPALAERGWTAREGGGGPGIGGATWDPNNLSFVDAGDGRKALQLKASTDGTGEGTSQAQLSHQRKFLEGTYASRVRFTDAPESGPDGDHVVQTFYTITPLDSDMDPNYGEADFEYLPNGGWGTESPTMYLTTWETYGNNPPQVDNVSEEIRGTYEGWHDLVAQIADGRVTYYIDGVKVADHGERYYPETPMLLNFNLWFIDGTPHERAEYVQQADWVYYAGGEVLSPADAVKRVDSYRADGVRHVDDVRGCTPGAR